jgi:hypothetical protein
MAGCIAIAGGNLCFSADSVGARITCSDFPIAGTFTCKEIDAMTEAWADAGKRAGCMSADGKTSGCTFVMPRPPR